MNVSSIFTLLEAPLETSGSFTEFFSRFAHHSPSLSVRARQVVYSGFIKAFVARNDADES